MNTTNYKFALKAYLTIICGLLFTLSSFAQENETAQDSTQTGYSLGSLTLPNPSSIISKYTYDPVTDRYIYTESVGDFNINYPIILTPKEFQDLVTKERQRKYYQDKISAYDGKTGDEDAQKNLLPEFYVNSGLFETIFGGNTIELIPQGSVELDLGVLWSKQDNPRLSARNPSNLSFDFDQRISLSLLGKVGTRLQVTANYDTESTFDFQNLIKLEYTPTEDDILQKIEVGNVSMPLNSSLITGAQSLFGVKTELQFGKTRVTGVFSEQRSQTRTVVAQGGGTLEEFEVFGLNYDENRHFFLSQYFRQQYDNALANYPFINSNVQITRIEVWITNRSNQTENVRNIVAFQDLGESELLDPTINLLQPGALPNNTVNGLNPENIGGAGSQITQQIRDIATVQQGLSPALGFQEGFDYVKQENARKLNQGSDYTYDSQLGYISLNQRLQNDEVLAVAFQYTVGNEVFQVGEFANDGVEATQINQDNNNQIINQNLVLKLLKSSITSVEENIWKLMMKNIYDTGAFQLSQEDFKLNIFWADPAPLNYITPVEGTAFPAPQAGQDPLEETPLLRVFNLDRLNYNNDPQANGDGFFDFVPGITVIPQNGKIIFTKVEPFGEYLFDKLKNAVGEDYNDVSSYNANQQKYVFDKLYKQTQTAALEDSEKNKFQLRGRYKSSGGDGIPIGAFNVPRGSVKVTAGGRVLVEGQDYTVNYQLGRVQILDEALKASNTPIQVSVENNAVFGQQTKRFMGLNVEHQFNENFVLGATYLSLNERPITQKANYNTEPINNSIFGINGNYSTELPFLTRLANKLPNIDTDVPSNLSLRAEMAYLKPGAPSRTNLNGEATAYIDDFEGTQNGIDLLSPLAWSLSSRPVNISTIGDEDGIESGYGRARLNWYSIDPIFYGSSAPDGVDDEAVSSVYTRRVFIDEIFPEVDIVQGQSTVINTLDLGFYPNERGPYNFNPTAADGIIDNPTEAWGGITRALTSTNFEQSNVEYIEFWLLDPFLENPNNPGGTLSFNLGSISEDILEDSRKQYENGLPQNGDVSQFPQTTYQTVVPQQQALIYTFDTTGQERINQDVGYDGYDDAEEAAVFGSQFGEDPANDNYRFYLNTPGNIFERYKFYNGVQGNSPETFTDTNRGSTTQPDVEDVNRDYTLNTIDSYFEYNIPINAASLADVNNTLIRDRKTRSVTLPNGSSTEVTWYQFRIPVEAYNEAVGGITDFRSIRFARMHLTGFQESTIMRFATLDLVRSDWRRYKLALDDETNAQNDMDPTEFNVGNIGLQENDGNYVLPPGVTLEELNNNNTVVRQNEQSLVLQVCDLEEDDSRAAFKNIDIDMRQYKRLRMFIHAEEIDQPLADNELVGFIRMGNDFTQNYYQIEIPLEVSPSGTVSPTIVWPEANEINIPIDVLSKIKSLGISEGTLGDVNPTFYNVIDGEIQGNSVGEFSNYPVVSGNQKFHRVGVKGNPSFGDIRVLMVGLKNGRPDSSPVCGEAWFNELRVSGLDNEGGWAAVVSMDTKIADFANISATGRRSTTGFGTIEQGPNERSREDVKQYDVVTNWNLGQLLPKKWGLQLPFNYAQSEELITPEYDQQYKDLKLQDRIDAAQTQEEKDKVRQQSENYTKRKSINFIGVRKNRTNQEKKPRFYDVENLTLNYSYNEVDHRDFEIERSLDQNIRAGAVYNYNFNPIKIEPFKKNDSLFRNKYFKILKDFNLNLLPTSFSVGADYNRQFSRQKFRDLDLGAGNIAVEELFRRNYTFDFQYNINYNITDALSLNFSAANNNIVRNYFVDDQLNGEQDSSLDVWDGFFDVGDPNRQVQQLGINYELPLNKIPTLSFLRATYSYTGDFQWQKGSDLFGNITGADGKTYDLGNSIQNANTHNINSTLDLRKLYRYVGLVKKPVRGSRNTGSQRPKGGTPQSNSKNNKKTKKKGNKFVNALIDVATSVKRIQVNYSENNGTFLPGYLQTPGFIGTLKPTVGFTFGSQSDIRNVAARNGWLTVFPDFNQQFTQNTSKILDISANVELVKDLKIDLTANRQFSENITQNFRALDNDNNGLSDEYEDLITNSFGNFNISTALIKTAFGKSDETGSAAFDKFRENRLTIARRLAAQRGLDPNDVDAEGFPIGYGKNSQAVLLPAFVSAYTGSDAGNVSLGAFRDFPIPNWTLKYTGFMKMKWFKKRFKRFSITHGYRSDYTINQFRKNLDYNQDNPEELDQGGNFKNEVLYSNINLSEQFSPLFRVDMEMKNSIKILAEMKKDRLLSLSLDNNLLTEIQGKEYILGLGYRIKNVRIKSKLAGPKKSIVSDLNMKADISIRDNKTIIRYLDVNNNQITSGQTIWSLKYSADYAFSKNLTGIFYFDYNFSEYAISTAFPQSSIRSGLTLRYNFGN